MIYILWLYKRAKIHTIHLKKLELSYFTILLHVKSTTKQMNMNICDVFIHSGANVLYFHYCSYKSIFLQCHIREKV